MRPGLLAVTLGGIALGAVVLSKRSDAASAPPAPMLPPSPPVNIFGLPITIWGAEWCPACRRARDFFQGAAVTERDVDDPAIAAEVRAVLAAAGVDNSAGYIPVIRIGTRVLVGFDEAKILEAIAAQAPQGWAP